MADDIQIKCIKKTDRMNPHERIQGVGGINPDGTPWYLSEDDAIAGIKAGKWRFWTTAGGKSVWVEVVPHHIRPYLKTVADGIHPNNLLALPPCP